MLVQTSMEKTEYVRLLKKALIKENIERILKMASGKDKMERILNEDYGRKEYFFQKNIVEARMFYRARVAMLPFAGN